MTTTLARQQPRPFDRGLRAMAIGRIALGAAALVAPAALARVLGVRDSPELTYLTRVFGSRAIALGCAYLAGAPTERTRLQRLCLGVDVCDTLEGVRRLSADDAPRRALVAMVLLTGSYAAIGGARVVADGVSCGQAGAGVASTQRAPV